MPKLAVGTIIRVHGWVMLAKLGEGEYRVSKISTFFDKQTYEFTKKLGKKRIASHYVRSVDLWVKNRGGSDLNWIEVVKT